LLPELIKKIFGALPKTIDDGTWAVGHDAKALENPHDTVGSMEVEYSQPFLSHPL
jgi:hypothetical protein